MSEDEPKSACKGTRHIIEAGTNRISTDSSALQVKHKLVGRGRADVDGRRGGRCGKRREKRDRRSGSLIGRGTETCSKDGDRLPQRRRTDDRCASEKSKEATPDGRESLNELVPGELELCSANDGTVDAVPRKEVQDGVKFGLDRDSARPPVIVRRAVVGFLKEGVSEETGGLKLSG